MEQARQTLRGGDRVLLRLSVSAALLLALVAVEYAAYPLVHRVDEAVSSMLGHSSNILVSAVAFTGSLEFAVLIAIGVPLWEAWRLRRPGRETLGLWASLAIVTLLTVLLKAGLALPRPAGLYESRAGGILGEIDQYSFPSGHASRAAAIAGYCSVGRRRAVRVLLWLWAVLVAAARVLQGVHWASDVAAGLVLGWFSSEAGRLVVELWDMERVYKSV